MRRLLLIGTSLLLSCASPLESFPTLANQGILPLSTTNAYVGSNLFVAGEFEQSAFLFNFLKARGAPAAIELVDEGMRSKPRMLMFYPKDKEVFAADLITKENSREWVIRGPFRIERKDYKNIARLDMSLIGEPVFQYRGRPYRFKFQPEAPVKVVTPVVPTPAPTPKPKPKKKTPPKIITSTGDVGIPTPVPEWKPLNSDQQALQMAQGFAERAANGDVIHTVTGESESLEALAEWYTGAPGNAKALAEANGIADGEKLAAGKRIQIPLKMIKQFKAKR